MNVLFMAYGTPYHAGETKAYYTDIRHGSPPPVELMRELEGRYRTIGRSPLNEISYAQAVRLEASLNLLLPPVAARLNDSPGPRLPGPAKVYFGTKHSRPTIGEALSGLAEDGAQKVVGLVAAPHESARGTAEYRAKVEEALRDLKVPLSIRYVGAYGTHPHYLQAVANRVLEQRWRLDQPDDALYLFTAHAIPVRAAADGQYSAQVQATARGVAARLNLVHWEVAWQSAGRTPGPWIGPDINERLERAASQDFKEVVVAPVGFPTDHLEVFFDIDFEAAHTAERLGLRLLRTRSLNAELDFIEVLRGLVLDCWGGFEDSHA